MLRQGKLRELRAAQAGYTPLLHRTKEGRYFTMTIQEKINRLAALIPATGVTYSQIRLLIGTDDNLPTMNELRQYHALKRVRIEQRDEIITEEERQKYFQNNDDFYRCYTWDHKRKVWFDRARIMYYTVG